MGFISDLFSSPGDKLPSNREMLEYMQSDRVGANPNVNSRYGSTDVQWDGDQATITQNLSPEYDALAQQQLQHLQGGPQQLGNYSNPTLESLFSMFGDRVTQRGGGGQPVGGLSQPPPQQMQQPQMGPQSGGQMPQMQAPQQPMNTDAMGVIQGNQTPEYFGSSDGRMGGGNTGGRNLSDILTQFDMAQNRFDQFSPMSTGR